MSARLLITLSLVGCGRLGFGEGGEAEVGTNATEAVDTSSPRAPAVVETVTFATAPSPDIDLAVTTTPTGAAVFWVPTAGGSLRGFEVELDRSASAVTMLRSGPFDQSSAAYVDGRLIATVRSGTRALVHDLPIPLAPGVEIANFVGDHVAKTALVFAGPDRIMATSCSELGYHAFDASWVGAENTYIHASGTSNHLDIAPIGARAITAISIDSGCHIEVATDRATSTMHMSGSFCEGVRLASDGIDEVAMMLENAGAVEIVIDASSTVNPAAGLPIDLGSSPRVVRHEGRFWISYLDCLGELVAGYVDGNMVFTRHLGVPTTAAGYELAVYDGAPWIFSVDPSTGSISGRRLSLQ